MPPVDLCSTHFLASCDRAADSAGLDADPTRGRLRFGAAGVLLRARSPIAPAIMSELFPTRLRGLGIGAWYNLTVALFGGTAPLVIQWLSNISHSSWFFWYVAVGAAVAFVATLTLPETKGSVLG
jgi:MFS transporter, MHS family, alpha-ketoglutarate permease